MKVFVLGAKGRMGTPICSTIDSAPDLDLQDAIDGADVVVDVTNADAARANLPDVAAAGAHAVVGTTGLAESDVAQLHQTFEAAGRSCFLVPNFSIGAVLMMRYAADAVKYFDGAEIIELHHEQKKDAPSGTAKLTAQRMGTPDAPIHSVRLPGLVAHQEVLFGTTGQSLTIRHDSYDRSSFMVGVLLSVRKVSELPSGVTTGLEAVL